MRAVAKRDNLCTLSLFALNLWLFRLKYVLKSRKYTLKKRRQIFRRSPGVVRGEEGGGGSAQLELTDA